MDSFSYTNKDFESIYAELLDLAKQISLRWDPSLSNESDPGVILLKLNAIIADKCNYNIDTNILECFPETVSQVINARHLYTQLGYHMKWYLSATTNVSLKYIGSSTTIPVYTIPKFTMVTTDDTDVIYTLVGTNANSSSDTLDVSDIQLSTDGSISSAKSIQGIAVNYDINGETNITIANLDSNNRLYFNTNLIAENGIFITNTGNNNYSSWVKKDNLLVEESGNTYYSFGVTDDGNYCYLEFPSDASSIFLDGITITYIKTNGISGNISASTLSKFYYTFSPTEDSSVTLNSDLVKITNPGSASNAKDVETIDEAYVGYKKTVGTFDTLITLRDYNNYINRSGLVSTGFVCDRTNDLQSTYVIQTTDGDLSTSIRVIEEDGIPGYYVTGNFYAGKLNTDPPIYYAQIVPVVGSLYRDISTEDLYKYTSSGSFSLLPTTQPSINAFQIKTYMLSNNDNVSTISEYQSTYEMLDPDEANVVQDYMQDMKSLQHDFLDVKAPSILSSNVCYFSNVFPVQCEVTTKYALDKNAATEVTNNIITSLLENFNAKALGFNNPVIFDDVYEVISSADSRIKNVSLQNIDFITHATCYNISGDGSFTDIALTDSAEDAVTLGQNLSGKYSAVVDPYIYMNKVGTINYAAITFSYLNTSWMIGNNSVSLSDYGIYFKYVSSPFTSSSNQTEFVLTAGASGNKIKKITQVTKNGVIIPSSLYYFTPSSSTVTFYIGNAINDIIIITYWSEVADSVEAGQTVTARISYKTQIRDEIYSKSVLAGNTPLLSPDATYQHRYNQQMPTSINNESYTATAGQTVFTIDDAHTILEVSRVTKNGSDVASSLYTVDLGTKTVTLTSGAAASDAIVIYYTYNQPLVLDNISSIKTNVDITLTNLDNTYELKNNESVQFYAPNLLEESSYSNYVKFEFYTPAAQKTISLNTHYQLLDNEYLLFYWKTSDDTSEVYKYSGYGPGNIFKSSFNITSNTTAVGSSLTLGMTEDNNYRVSTSTDGDMNWELSETIRTTLAGSQNILSSSKTIAIEKTNSVVLESTGGYYCYWIRNEKSSDFLYYEFPTAKNVILDTGEYFIYSNSSLSDLNILGAGSEIFIADYNNPTWKVKVIDTNTVLEDGVNALSNYWKLVTSNVSCIENQFVTVTNGCTIKLEKTGTWSRTISRTGVYSSGTVSNLNDFTISYKTPTDTSYTTLSQIDLVGLNDVAVKWSAQSLLQLDITSSVPQRLLSNQSIEYDAITTYDILDSLESGKYDSSGNKVSDADYLRCAYSYYVAPSSSCTLSYDFSTTISSYNVIFWKDNTFISSYSVAVSQKTGSAEISVPSTANLISIYYGSSGSLSTSQVISTTLLCGDATGVIDGENYNSTSYPVTILSSMDLITDGSSDKLTTYVVDTYGEKTYLSLYIFKELVQTDFTGFSLAMTTDYCNVAISAKTSGSSESVYLNFSLPVGDYIIPVRHDETLNYSLQLYSNESGNSTLMSEFNSSGNTELKTKGLYYLVMHVAERSEYNFTIRIVRGDVTSALTLTLYNPYKYTHAENITSEYFDRVLDLINRFDPDNKFNYIHNIDRDYLIEDPLDPTSFFNSHFIYSPFTICKLDTTSNTSIYVAGKK